PLAALTRRTPWLALSGLILLSYIPQFLGVPLFPWVYLAIWGPFLILLAREKAAPARTLTPQPPLPPLHPPSLGEGEKNGGDEDSPLPGRGKGVAGEGPGVRARAGERSRQEDVPP
ncbi:MAG TPA: hypothetical protein VLQ45_13725, partial [Thermoanaerobaculia bacterium]|nr:hypothetical protein [Thermoanaerobaculia bacterium]